MQSIFDANYLKHISFSERECESSIYINSSILLFKMQTLFEIWYDIKYFISCHFSCYGPYFKCDSKAHFSCNIICYLFICIPILQVWKFYSYILWYFIDSYVSLYCAILFYLPKMFFRVYGIFKFLYIKYILWLKS